MTAAAVGPTRYERTPRNCARSLSDFAGCTEPGSLFGTRRGSARGLVSSGPRRLPRPDGS